MPSSTRVRSLVRTLPPLTATPSTVAMIFTSASGSARDRTRQRRSQHLLLLHRQALRQQTLAAKHCLVVNVRVWWHGVRHLIDFVRQRQGSGAAEGCRQQALTTLQCRDGFYFFFSYFYSSGTTPTFSLLFLYSFLLFAADGLLVGLGRLLRDRQPQQLTRFGLTELFCIPIACWSISSLPPASKSSGSALHTGKGVNQIRSDQIIFWRHHLINIRSDFEYTRV